MSSERKKSQHFSRDYKLRMLKEFYESGCSKYSFSKKNGIDKATFSRWIRAFESESLSLPDRLSALETQVYMARKKSVESNHPTSQTETDRLRDEVTRLRKALAYSELRNEALNEVLKIGREQYGIDLLKKAGAKQ